MSQAAPYLWGVLIGLLTGLFYFAGLWLTVQKVPCSKRPNQLLVLSFAARLLPTLVLMFLVIRQDPGMFVAMLIGFFCVRFVMTNRIVPQKHRTTQSMPHTRAKK